MYKARALWITIFLAAATAAGCSDKDAPPWNGGIPGRVKFYPTPVDAQPPADTLQTDAVTDAAADAPVPDGNLGCSAPSPGTITVTGGVISGITLAGTPPTITAVPGALLAGTIEVSVARTDSCATCSFSLTATTSWESPGSAYWCEGGVPSGTSTKTVSVSRAGPTQAGDYHIILAGLLDHGCEEVASATTGTAAWGDGNDVALWGSKAISEATGTGTVCADWLVNGATNQVLLPAAAVRIVVN